jgi:hypothetical protein
MDGLPGLWHYDKASSSAAEVYKESARLPFDELVTFRTRRLFEAR